MDTFSSKTNLSTATSFRHELLSTCPDITMLVVQQEGMGRTFARSAVADILAEFDAGLIICLGIAGSLTKDIGLADVCYSNTIADVLDNSSITDKKRGQLDVSLSFSHYSTPREIVTALNFCRTQPELKPAYLNWQNEQSKHAAALGLTDLKSPDEPKPITTDGIIVCAAVSKSETYNDKLRAIDRKVTAVETESGGVFQEASRHSIIALTIRGISDMANGDKAQLEQRTNGNVRKLAALNAATFLRLQLSNPYFVEAVKSRRLSHQHFESSEQNGPESNEPSLTSTIINIGQHIDEQLRELSPDFRLQQYGYRLPTPRMRQVQTISSGSRPDPTEIRDALITRSHALLRLNRHYPDNSLPWVIANDLLTSEINGKQIIPVVIDGESVTPPRSSFAAVAGYTFAHLKDHDGIQIVFIINGLPIKSKNRLKYLGLQIDQYPSAKFLFITRAETIELAETELGKIVTADTFELCGISFLEISHFVQKNFGMTGSEAEVIALRLRETFQHFNLSAHPSYFAGIPREVLSALLQANRRAELIQLAVDGFLSFVVAGDTADVALSRTTRLRYLKRLAIALNVEKHSFSQEETVAFTRSFSTEFDFGIDPLAFVNSFVDAGILHFKNDRVGFSLPFIESYVLASALASEPQTAARHFVLGPDFNMNCFDLYAEIGASDHVVCRIIEGLEETLSEWGLKADETHILLTDKVRPSMMSRPEQIEAIQKRLQRTAEDIEHGRGDTKKKQRILDVADRVKEEAADSAIFGIEDRRAYELDRVGIAVQNWVIGTLLLGAGAEHLDAEMKQMLASLLVQVSAVIAHRTTEAMLLVNFGEIKRKIFEDKPLIEAISDLDEQDEQTIKRFISGVIDVLEYSLLSTGVRRVLDQLCEGARQRVLATTVEKASVHGTIEEIIRAAWLADIESKRGKDMLVSAIKQLPPSPFLRSSLAAHFAYRVYWNHWRKEDRFALLSAAEECLKGIGVQIKKGELKRFIENSISDSSDCDSDVTRN
ncbi:hypothetical protein L1A21_09710 [Rhodopseudomonas palustris]|nr:hypothetical protein L1A21_09710 [Rhodopseudomonas palustris]